MKQKKTTKTHTEKSITKFFAVLFNANTNQIGNIFMQYKQIKQIHNVKGTYTLLMCKSLQCVSQLRLSAARNWAENAKNDPYTK